ncbi:MAG: winged helix-turn-helix domain-containing protein [Paludibacteraceae bacterium]|jgi:hypothetical protein|nr:winged helix-turn-helix domain-containing protein [Paludibacteraceae bacterium]MCR5298404.1 winged helix-turn-helix domain-containing protein [Paludibacteraceae bacterium]
MKVEEIGTNAGKVWEALNDGSKKTTAEIKKVTKLTDKEIYAAIGWLAREGKINVEQKGASVAVNLI